MIKYKNEAGEWVEYKASASSVTTKTGVTVQRELDKNKQGISNNKQEISANKKEIDKNKKAIYKTTEAIRQLEADGGNIGYITSPSGTKFKLCVTDSGELYTTMMKIPRVDIIGSLSGIGKDRPVTVELKYDGEKQFHKKAKLEWQGNSSIGYSKKNYSVDLLELDGVTKCKMTFRNWVSTDSFHLKANWIDSTHARNVLNARWAKKMFDVTYPTGGRCVIDGFPVEVYLNDQFQGIYTWNLKQGKDLFQMDKSNPNHLMYRSEDHSGAGSFANLTTSEVNRVWQNRIPKQITDHTKLIRMIQWVGTASNDEFKANISQYLDLTSCINYYVMMDLMFLPDNRCKNMTLATWDGLVWYPIFYDLDTSWGLYWDGASTYPATKELLTGSKLWDKLVANFGDEIKARYIEVRKSIFTKTNIINEFEAFAKEIGEDNYKKDQTKWTGIPSKNYGIPFIKNWINERFAYLDKKYGVTFDD